MEIQMLTESTEDFYPPIRMIFSETLAPMTGIQLGTEYKVATAVKIAVDQTFPVQVFNERTVIEMDAEFWLVADEQFIKHEDNVEAGAEKYGFSNGSLRIFQIVLFYPVSQRISGYA